MNVPPVTRNILGWSAVGVGIIASLTVIPNSVFNFKPIQRFEDKMGGAVLADSKTGDLFTWIDSDDGKVFVKLDKNSESSVSGTTYEEPAPKQSPEKAASNDVRSGKIFKVSDTYKSGNTSFNVDAQVKYRAREQGMLYRVSFAPTLSEEKTCPSKADETQLKKLYDAANKSVLRFRFHDSDKFWVQDLTTPLGSDIANNKRTTIIDINKGNCPTIKEIVFHGRANNFYLPSFSWVDNGKLLFGGVKLGK